AARPPYRGRSGVENTHEVPRIDDGGQIVCAGELEYRDMNAMIKLPRFKQACPRASTSAAPPANISSMRFAAGLRPARTGDQAGTVKRQSVQPKGPHNRRNVPARDMPAVGHPTGCSACLIHSPSKLPSCLLRRRCAMLLPRVWFSEAALSFHGTTALRLHLHLHVQRSPGGMRNAS